MSFFKILALSPSLLIIPLVTSCNQQSTTKQIDELKESYNQLTDKIAKKVSEEYQAGEKQVSKLTDNEIKKLRTIEYKVIDIELDLNSSDIEKKLAELGVDRWDCFHIEKQTNQLKAFCKRVPLSHLRTLARISKIIP